MRKRIFLVPAALLLVAMVLTACGRSEAAADTPSPTTQPTSTSLPSQEPSQQVSEQRIKDLEFRISGLERLLSAGDGMFSVTDDLSVIEGRLRFQQECMNALVLIAGLPSPADGETGTSAREIFETECGKAVAESSLENLASQYGLER